MNQQLLKTKIAFLKRHETSMKLPYIILLAITTCSLSLFGQDDTLDFVDLQLPETPVKFEKQTRFDALDHLVYKVSIDKDSIELVSVIRNNGPSYATFTYSKGTRIFLYQGPRKVKSFFLPDAPNDSFIYIPVDLDPGIKFNRFFIRGEITNDETLALKLPLEVWPQQIVDNDELIILQNTQ